MAQQSMFWATGTTGDGTSTYSEDTLLAWLKRTFLIDPTTQGVLHNYGSELSVSGATSPLSVATGAAIVNGIPYENDATVNLAVPTPAVGTTGHRVVLRADYTANTVRLVLISSLDGVSLVPAVTQSGSVWEIPIAGVTITTGGAISLSDQRSYVHFNTKVSSDMIDDQGMTTAKIGDGQVTGAKIASGVAGNGLTHDGTTIAINTDGTTIELSSDALRVKDNGIDDTKVGDRVPQFYRRQGGSATNWGSEGTTTYTPAAVRMQAGVVLITIAASTNTGGASITLPTAFSYTPIVFLTATGYTLPTTTFVSFNVNVISTSTFDIEVRTGTTTHGGFSMAINWLAIGPE